MVAQPLGLAILLAAVSQAAPQPSASLASDAGHANSTLSAQGAPINQPVVFCVPPHARFVAPDTAVISWETHQPSEGIIEYGVGREWDRRIQDPGLRTAHRISLRGLDLKALYQYRIRTGASGKSAFVSEAFELDNAMNYAVAAVSEAASPYGSDAGNRRDVQAAEQILSASGVTRGYCLILGCNEGQLAYELAKRSELIVFGVDKDRGQIARARALLGKAGVYGSRITLHQADSLDSLPFPKAFANLIVENDPLAARNLPRPPPRYCRCSNPQLGWHVSGRHAPRPAAALRITWRNGSAKRRQGGI